MQRGMLSREAPPTTLAGGYKVGDKVYFVGGRHTFPSGNRLEYGKQGEVTGGATGDEKDTHVAVQFPGNKGLVNCPLTELSRTKPK